MLLVHSIFPGAWCHVIQVSHALVHVLARVRALATAFAPCMYSLVFLLPTVACVARNLSSVLAVWVRQGAVVKETQFHVYMCL